MSISEARKDYEREMASIDRDTLDAMTAWLREDDGRIECFYEMFCAELQIHASKTSDAWRFHNVGTRSAMHKAFSTFSPFGWDDWGKYLWASIHPEHELYKKIPKRYFECVACAEHPAEFLG